MCGYLGITHIYTHPYHHQANGRAERAGQQVREVIRKFNADERRNWMELLPRALKIIHDTPGESGLSPYEIFLVGKGLQRTFPTNPRVSVKTH